MFAVVSTDFESGGARRKFAHGGRVMATSGGRSRVAYNARFELNRFDRERAPCTVEEQHVKMSRSCRCAAYFFIHGANQFQLTLFGNQFGLEDTDNLRGDRSDDEPRRLGRRRESAAGETRGVQNQEEVSMIHA